MNKHKTTIVVRLILEKENQILFLKKTTQNGGGFSSVGGKLDNGESANLAIIRESQEEANIIIKRKHLRLVHIFKRDSAKELILVYSSKKWKGEPKSNELKKFQEVVWISTEELPNNVSPVTQHILKTYFSKKFFSEEIQLSGMEDELDAI